MIMHVFALCALLALTACDTKDRTPISGKRQDFLQLMTPQLVDSSLSNTPVHLGSPVVNSAWMQPSGQASHATAHLKVADKPQRKWSTAAGTGSYDGRYMMANVVTDAKYAYVLDTQGQVSAFDKKTGKVIWAKYVLAEGEGSEDMLGGGISLDNGMVFASTSFGRVYALDSEKGTTKWSVDLGSPIRAAATPHNGRLFVTTINNQCFAVDMYSGKILWSHQGITESTSLLGFASPAAQEDTIIAAYSSGEVFALQASNGHVLWGEVLTSGIRSDTLSAFPHIRARPVIDNGSVICINYGGTMASLDLKTGQRQWQVPLSGMHTPAITSNFVFVVGQDNGVYAIDRSSGRMKWRVQLSSVRDGDSISYAGPILVNNQLVLSESLGHLVFLDVDNGKEKSRIKLGGNYYLSPVVSNESFFVLTEDGYLSCWG